MTTRLERELAKLKQGDHVCPIHEGRSEQMAVAIPFIRNGLIRGERCLLVADDPSMDTTLRAFAAANVDVAAERERGALQILTKQDAYLRSGEFNPHAMIDFLAQAEASALADGYSGLRCLGEMTWILGTKVDCDQLVEYEVLLNDLLVQSRSVILCQYDRSRFDPALIHDILLTHPIAILGERVSPNPYYEPPELVLNRDQFAHVEFKRKRVNWWYRQLEAAMTVEQERDRAEAELRAAEQQLHALVGRLNNAREEEAKRIARELHDDLGQRLTALGMELARLEMMLTDATPGQRAQIARMHTVVDRTLEVVQELSSEIRLGQLDVLGLTAAVEWQAKEFSRRSAIPCKITRLDEIANLSDAQRTAVFRILQEALTNIVRHAGATGMEISLQAGPDRLALKVHDNGRGITAAELSDRKSIGLLGMRERAQAVGGEVTITGGAGAGTTVLVTIPLHQPGATTA